MPENQPTMIALNPVIGDRADDFEEWLRTVVVPAVRQHDPDKLGRWHVLRAAAEEDGVRIFAFLFDGGGPADWDLQAILVEALGDDGARETLQRMQEMLVGVQYGWSVTPVDLG